jgi:GNAT superfamily N-acetyltransferase
VRRWRAPARAGGRRPRATEGEGAAGFEEVPLSAANRALARLHEHEVTTDAGRPSRRASRDDAFIDGAMPALTVTLPSITAGAVRMAERAPGEVLGVVELERTGVDGIALLGKIFLDPSYWKRGIGRLLFEAAVNLASDWSAGALVIYAERSAEGFYRRLGAIRIGETSFWFSPEIILPRLIFILPEQPMESVPLPR